MRFFLPALSIAVSALTACASLGVPDIFAPDQIPPPVRAQPSVVGAPPPVTTATPWPLLGAVPPRPKDFSTPKTYNGEMDELTKDRAAAQAEKAQAGQQTVFAPIDGLTPPQLPLSVPSE